MNLFKKKMVSTEFQTDESGDQIQMFPTEGNINTVEQVSLQSNFKLKNAKNYRAPSKQEGRDFYTESSQHQASFFSQNYGHRRLQNNSINFDAPHVQEIFWQLPKKSDISQQENLVSEGIERKISGISIQSGKSLELNHAQIMFAQKINELATRVHSGLATSMGAIAPKSNEIQKFKTNSSIKSYQTVNFEKFQRNNSKTTANQLNLLGLKHSDTPAGNQSPEHNSKIHTNLKSPQSSHQNTNNKFSGTGASRIIEYQNKFFTKKKKQSIFAFNNLLRVSQIQRKNVESDRYQNTHKYLDSDHSNDDRNFRNSHNQSPNQIIINSEQQFQIRTQSSKNQYNNLHLQHKDSQNQLVESNQKLLNSGGKMSESVVAEEEQPASPNQMNEDYYNYIKQPSTFQQEQTQQVEETDLLFEKSFHDDPLTLFNNDAILISSKEIQNRPMKKNNSQNLVFHIVRNSSVNDIQKIGENPTNKQTSLHTTQKSKDQSSINKTQFFKPNSRIQLLNEVSTPRDQRILPWVIDDQNCDFDIIDYKI